MSDKSPLHKATRDQRMGARRALLEELFNDFYDDRRHIYRMNFFRGIFFGLGSVLGGTVVVALVVWLLSLFVQIPGIGDAAQQAQSTLESHQSK
ncbi:MAG: hypothetical protein H6797_02465 [Candidatus Nomurabacteria bacterium]|nr:MAG: hypothetical protein H6797_02465 [Candidatus Nomurabacteria bacterium]